MKTILVSLLATLLLTTTSRADVVIYRGVIKLTADLTTGAPFGNKPVSLYVVTDYDGAQFGTLAFGRINGGKHFIQANAATADFAKANLPKGRTASFFIFGSTSETDATHFSLTTLLIRGTDQSLLIRKTPATTLVNRPNFLKGIGVLGSSSGSGAAFGEEKIGTTFQGTKTIKANNASQTLNQVLDALAAELTAKGFTSI